MSSTKALLRGRIKQIIDSQGEQLTQDWQDEVDAQRRELKKYNEIKRQEDLQESSGELDVISCESMEHADYVEQSKDVVYELDDEIEDFYEKQDMQDWQDKVDEQRRILKKYNEIERQEDLQKGSGELDEISCEAMGHRDDLNQMNDVHKESPLQNNTSVRTDLKVESYEKTEEKKIANLNENDRSLYDFALDILDKYDFEYLDPPDPLSENKLHRFNGRFWEPMCNEDIELIVYGEMDDKERAEQGNIKSFCKRVADFIIFECKDRYESGPRFTEEDFKAIENQIVFKNCVYDVRTGETLPHDKTLPYYFGIDAEYTKVEAHTPMYDKLKKDATKGDADSMDMFDFMIGYLMIPNRSAKCYFTLAYEKDSGKSILGHFIESMYMGMRVKTIDLEHLAGRFSLSNADTTILLSGLETSMDKLTEAVAAQIKRITGEQTIRMEAKYKGECDVPIRFKLLLATNGGMLLAKNIVDSAFYRRTMVIPFIQSTPLENIIADMPERLQEEKSAILSKAARKLKNIINFDGGIRFPESAMSLMIKKIWIKAADHDENFIKSELVFTGNSDDALPKDDIYTVYESYFKNTAKNMAGAIMCSKKDLMRKISRIYPGAVAKKLRRGSLENANDIRLRPCIAGLKWK